MSDEPFYAPNRRPDPPRQPQPGERLFEFLRGHDRFLCELRDRGPYGVEAQFYQNEEFRSSQQFETRALAVAWAEGERTAIEQGPCVYCGGAGWVCEAHPAEPADHAPSCQGAAVACIHCSAAAVQ
jgi:hypothetical protein